MVSIKSGVLILTPFYFPNIGGVETHLSDLAQELSLNNYQVYVHTYSPLTTPNTSWKVFESHNNLEIYRYFWFGKSIFHWIEKYPLLDFIYLTPYLFIRTFIWLIFNHRKIKTIHSQGLNAALIGNIFQKIFHIRHVTSIHAIYSFKKNTLNSKLVKFILEHSSHVLSLSQSSKQELISIGVSPSKISVYTYWIDLELFKPLKKLVNHKKLKVLFVGRLIKKKGILTLVNVAKKLKQIEFDFIGVGPLANYLTKIQSKINNIKYLGQVPNNQLTHYYQQSDILCVPSQYNEGFGRVVMEAMACGVPVVASNRGGITEAVDNTVAFTVPPKTKNLIKIFNHIVKNPKIIENLKKKCRPFAFKKYSSSNLKLITKYY